MIPVGVKLILDDTNANIPANWEEDTSYAGRYALGAATDADGGTNGGNATHTHNIVSHTHTFSSTVSSALINMTLSVAVRGFATTNHNHASATSNATSSASGTASNDPPYYEVIFITPSAAPQDIPAGVIGLFEDALPAGWNNYAGLNNKFLKGVASGGDAGGTGGTSDAHTHNTDHTHAAKNSSVCSAGTKGPSAGGGTYARSTHQHSVALTSGSANASNDDATPTYRDLIPATSGSTETPLNVIGLWDSTVASIPSGWTRVTNQDDKMLRADSSVGTGGADTHTHTASGAHNHGYTAGNATTNITGDKTLPVPSGMPAAHDHEGADGSWNIGNTSANLSANTSKSAYPLYRTTIFVKLTDLGGVPQRTLVGVGT